MGQIATIERSRLKALDIETVIALSTAHNWPRVRNMWNSLLHGHGDRTECETQLTNRTYIMSHSTEIKVEIGLDSYHLHCGSRHPAEYCGVAANQSKTFADDAAGRMACFIQKPRKTNPCTRAALAGSKWR